MHTEQAAARPCESDVQSRLCMERNYSLKCQDACFKQHKFPFDALWDGSVVRTPLKPTVAHVLRQTTELTTPRCFLFVRAQLRILLFNHWLQLSRVQRFVALDWDTAVFVPSSFAWRELRAAAVGKSEPAIASCVHPTHGWANHVFTAATRDAMQDLTNFTAAIMSTRVPLDCLSGLHAAFPPPCAILSLTVPVDDHSRSLLRVLSCASPTSA